MQIEKRLNREQRRKKTFYFALDVSEKLKELSKLYSSSQNRVLEALLRNHIPEEVAAPKESQDAIPK